MGARRGSRREDERSDLGHGDVLLPGLVAVGGRRSDGRRETRGTGDRRTAPAALRREVRSASTRPSSIGAAAAADAAAGADAAHLSHSERLEEVDVEAERVERAEPE